jgi:hypothetical protein
MADLVTNDPLVLGRPPERKSTGRKHGVLPVGSLISRAGRLPVAGSSATTGNRRAQDRTGAAMVALVGEALVFTGKGF